MSTTVGFDIFTISQFLVVNYSYSNVQNGGLLIRKAFQFSFRPSFWSGSISFRSRKWFLWHFIWLRQFGCKHRYWFSLFKSSQILTDPMKENYFAVHNLILLWWLSPSLAQYNVKGDKKSCRKNMWIKTLKLHFKKTFVTSKPITTIFIE